jgi:serine/threonine protein kinase
LVMEYLRGETLSNVVRGQGKLHWTLAAEIVRHCLEGLKAAHNQGVVHRDVKPANVFLLSDPRQGVPVRLLDLGLAKDLTDWEDLTRMGQVAGTPNYMAPEILLGTPADGGGKRADVFAVGMMFFVMLTASLPFPRKPDLPTPAAHMAHRAHFYRSCPVLPGPAYAEATVPAAIDAIVRRALRCEPEARYADAAAMLADLADQVSSTSIVAKLEMAARINTLAANAQGAAAAAPKEPVDVGPLWANPQEGAVHTPLPATPLPVADSPRRGGSEPPPVRARPERLLTPSSPRPMLEGRQSPWPVESSPVGPSSEPPGPENQSSDRPSIGRLVAAIVGAVLGVLVVTAGGLAAWLILTPSVAPARPAHKPTTAAATPSTTEVDSARSVQVTLVGVPAGAEVRFNQQRVQGAVLRAPRDSAGLLEVVRPGHEPLRRIVNFDQDRFLDLVAELSAPAKRLVRRRRSRGPDGVPGVKAVRPFQAASQPSSGAAAAQERPAARTSPRRSVKSTVSGTAGAIQDPWAQ